MPELRQPGAGKREQKLRKRGIPCPESGKIIAFEIKAGIRISGEDLRGLRLLKDRLGSRLHEAIVLYTGEHSYQHDGLIWILSLSQLWA